MIVSHKHKFIFLKTLKTASTSMETALSTILGPEDIITPSRPDLEKARERGVGGQNYRLDHPCVPKVSLWRRLLRRPERYYHPTVGYYEHMPAWRAKLYLGDEIWKNYYKFAFERNPWDRQISYYFYKTHNKGEHSTLEHFLSCKKKAWVPNYEIYTIDKELSVDFVGRYENLAEDFETAMTVLGLNGKVQLPITNVSEKKGQDYRTYYTSKTKEKVATWYDHEIKFFGYEF